nr:phage holin family protein [Actinomycetota bacterium]
MSDRPSEQDWHRENGRTEGRSAGRLMKEITEDISTLIRKEIELAKQELGTSVATKAKGAAILAVVAVMGFLMLIFLLLGLRDGLDSFLWTWVADLVTVGVLGIIALVAALIAKRKLATPIKADMTKKTIKEDVEWAKTLGKQ